MQIKSKSKIKKKQRGSFSDKSHSKDLSSKDSADKDSNVLNPESHNNEKSSIVQQEIGAAYVVPKQCPKLYWGYVMAMYHLVIDIYINLDVFRVLCIHKPGCVSSNMHVCEGLKTPLYNA